MARTTEELQAEFERLRELPEEYDDPAPRNSPLATEQSVGRELRRLHDFCGRLLDEILELRARA